MTHLKLYHRFIRENTHCLPLPQNSIIFEVNRTRGVVFERVERFVYQSKQTATRLNLQTVDWCNWGDHKQIDL